MNWESFINRGQFPWSFWGLGILGGVVLFVLGVAVAVWSLYWKYKALWKAAHLGHRGWFIALLIINTLGILEILYYYIFSEQKPTDAHGRDDGSPGSVKM